MHRNPTAQGLSKLDPCPIVVDDGSACGQPGSVEIPFAVCDVHAVAIYRSVAQRMAGLADDPEFQAKMRTDSVRVLRERERTRLANRAEVIYYLQVGEFIKIGYTSRLRHRLKTYPLNRRLLATEPGDMDVERQRHQQFRGSQAFGREWFQPGPALMRHINGLREAEGAAPVPIPPV